MSKFKSLPRAVDADRKTTNIAVSVHPGTVSASIFGTEEFGTLDFEGGGGSTRATIFLHTPEQVATVIHALQELHAAMTGAAAGFAGHDVAGVGSAL